MSTSSSKGDPNPKDFEKLYYELLESMDNLGFQLSLNARNLKTQYHLDKKAREEGERINSLEGIGKP